MLTLIFDISSDFYKRNFDSLVLLTWQNNSFGQLIHDECLLNLKSALCHHPLMRYVNSPLLFKPKNRAGVPHFSWIFIKFSCVSEKSPLLLKVKNSMVSQKISQFSSNFHKRHFITHHIFRKTKKPLHSHNYDKPDPTTFADEPRLIQLVMLV